MDEQVRAVCRGTDLFSELAILFILFMVFTLLGFPTNSSWYGSY